MLKVTMLLPTTYNNESPIEQSLIDDLLRGLLELCGGYTKDGLVEGTYTMDSGEVTYDRCHKVWVVCDSSMLSAIRCWASEACATLQQECVYLEHQEANIEFVLPRRSLLYVAAGQPEGVKL